MEQASPKWFVRGDVDGFFGLFVDNLLQLMLIVVLGGAVAGLPSELIATRILPGAAISILVGNLFYARQARKLMIQTGRDDVTALPYGINTPSLFAYIFLIMAPIYRQTNDPMLAWRVGLFACLISGIFEVIGAFVGDKLRDNTPRAAMLSALAGIAVTFISMGFVFQIFASPAIGIIPMFIILAAYASRVRLPYGLPGGLVAVIIGVMLAWGLRLIGLPYFDPPSTMSQIGMYPPIPVFGEVLSLLTSDLGWSYMAVIFPMGLFNVIGSLQNLESAEAAGDRFETKPSLLANGTGTLIAACFGSAFPTTIYIGHPGWKAMGARAGYSAINGAVIAVLCFFGVVTSILQIVPLEATLGVLLWIGIIISAQAFRDVPGRHALAVAIGLLPSLAAWALTLIEQSLQVSGSSLYEAAPKFGGALYIHGVIALNQGFLLSSMILSAILVYLIDSEFRKAAIWAAIGAALSAIGLIHAYELNPMGIENKFGWFAAPEFACAYLATAAMFFWLARTRDGETDRETQ